MSHGNTLAILPFFVRDYIAATRHMSLAERGAYTDLLWLQWEMGPLPRDLERLARMIGCSSEEFRTVWQTVECKFIETDTGIVNRRLEQHRDEALFRRDRKVLGADIANAKRAAKRSAELDAKRTAQRGPGDAPSATLSGTPPSPSPSPSPNPSPDQNSRAEARRERRDLHDQIIDLYHDVLPHLPRVKAWTDKRRKALDARIAERLKDGKPADHPDYWREFFATVADSSFLSGREGVWRADLEWLLTEKNFVKVIEGRYANRSGHVAGGARANA